MLLPGFRRERNDYRAHQPREEKPLVDALGVLLAVASRFAVGRAVLPSMGEGPTVLFAESEAPVLRSEAERTVIRHGIAAGQVGEVG